MLWGGGGGGTVVKYFKLRVIITLYQFGQLDLISKSQCCKDG